MNEELLDVPVRTVGDTGKSVVPSHESGEEAEITTGLDQGCAGGTTRVMEVSSSEEEEGEIEEEEEEEECDGGLECAYQEDSGEDEPALYRVLVVCRINFVGFVSTYKKI